MVSKHSEFENYCSLGMNSFFNEYFSDAGKFHFLVDSLLFYILFINHIAGSLLHSTYGFWIGILLKWKPIGNLGKSRCFPDLICFSSHCLGSSPPPPRHPLSSGTPPLRMIRSLECSIFASLADPGAPRNPLVSISQCWNNKFSPHLAFYVCEDLN